MKSYIYLFRKISQIEYNCLNLFPQRQYGLRLGNLSKLDCSRLAPYLPQRISYQDGSRVLYTYDAGGVKLRTDYCGNFIYENDSLKQILFDGGYIHYEAPGNQPIDEEDSVTDYSVSIPVYQFYVQDHLGNIRVVADEKGNIEQINHYYPFGGLMGESRNLTSNQKYKYNGKELDRMHGLDWYDYGARMYDAALGLWHSMDPLAEKYYGASPYVYCKNDPINAFDPDGKREWPVNKTYKGKTRYFLPNYHQSRPGHLHQGVDINIGSRKDDLGALVLATHSGIVTLKKSYHDKNGAGNRVKITSKDGKVATLYMHLNSFAKGLKVGSVVKESQQIGTIGGSGFGSLSGQNVHLHYEMFVDGKHVNPAENNKHLKDPQKMSTDKAPVIDVPQE